jgi:hypothetical protein
MLGGWSTPVARTVLAMPQATPVLLASAVARDYGGQWRMRRGVLVLVSSLGAIGACGGRVIDDADVACAASAAAPVVIATTHHVPAAITTDEQNVYWVELGAEADGSSSLMAMPKGGGAPRALADVGRSGGQASATDDAYVYVSARWGVITRVPKGGGASVVLASRGDLPPSAQQWWRLALDAASVYWVDVGPDQRLPGPPPPGQGSVLRVAKSGGPTQVVASGQTGLSDIAVNGDHIYWAAQDGVWRRSKATGSIEHVVDTAMPPGSRYALTLDERFLYWSDANGVPRLPLEGGPQQTVIAAPARVVGLEGSCAYAGTMSGLLRALRGGGAAAELATWGGVDEMPVDVAVDDTGVYWTTVGTGSGYVRWLATAGRR